MFILAPLFAMAVFANRALVPAIVIALLVPYLFLPVGYRVRLPGVPDLDKTSMISIGLLIGVLFFGAKQIAKNGLPKLTNGSKLLQTCVMLCLVTIFVGICLTVMNNREFLIFGPRYIPAMRPWDLISLIADLILLLVPFFVARRYLATPDAHYELLRLIVIWALVYSLLMLVEFRMSPQLHNWIYGYFQHSFAQHIRDGFRPMVFLTHGLAVGFFIFTAVLAAAALWQKEKDTKWLWALAWLFLILLNSKNLAASLLGILFLGVMFGLRTKMQIWVAAIVAMSVLFYPALRQAHLIPIDTMMSAAESYSEARARSLGYRLYNEDLMLERVAQKPLTGWGNWGRDRIYNEDGRETTILDGLWIIILGRQGWLGYIGLFGILTIPVIFLLATRKRKPVPPETMALILVSAGNLIYMIPNATLTPLGLLIFGAVAGFAQNDATQESQTDAVTDGHDLRQPNRYTRFPHTPQRSRGQVQSE